MATKSQKMKISFIEQLRELPNLNEDRWSNFKALSSTHIQYHVKLNKTSWRLEYNAAGRWCKLHGAFYTATNTTHVMKIRDYCAR